VRMSKAQRAQGSPITRRTVVFAGTMTKGVVAPLALHICPPALPATQGDLAREITRATCFTHCLMCVSRASAKNCTCAPPRPNPRGQYCWVLGSDAAPERGAFRLSFPLQRRNALRCGAPGFKTRSLAWSAQHRPLPPGCTTSFSCQLICQESRTLFFGSWGSNKPYPTTLAL
jgi:hypothetical protein